ncbi:MAG TPA: ABC transporter ATP-binding protein, partial [Terriglobia bacterium]|nr:ABC transporter ATP-binding protein [Terriglobia bacterium]
MHDEEVLGKAYDARLMRRLIRYLRPYRKYVLFAFLMIVASAALETIPPLLTMLAIDRYIAAGNAGGLAIVAGAFVLTLAVKLGTDFIQALTLQRTGQRIMCDMRMQIFRHLQSLSPSFYDKNPVGRLITRVISDVDVLNELFSSGLVSVFGDIFTLTGIIVAMLLLDWRMALVTLTVLPLIGIATAIFRSRARDSYRRVRVAVAKINAFLNEHITGMSVVQLYNREKRSASRFAAINEEHRL